MSHFSGTKYKAGFHLYIYYYPVDTGRCFNVDKTSIRRCDIE